MQQAEADDRLGIEQIRRVWICFCSLNKVKYFDSSLLVVNSDPANCLGLAQASSCPPCFFPLAFATQVQIRNRFAHVVPGACIRDDAEDGKRVAVEVFST